MSQTAEQIAAEDEALGPCRMCGGKKSEHADRVHAFTTQEGDLVTKEQDRKRRERPQPVHLHVPSNVILNRLVELLHTKGVIDDQDLMFITGIKGASDGDGS